MHGVGEIAKRYDLPIQSHMSETKNEIAFVKKNVPRFELCRGVQSTKSDVAKLASLGLRQAWFIDRKISDGSLHLVDGRRLRLDAKTKRHAKKILFASIDTE